MYKKSVIFGIILILNISLVVAFFNLEKTGNAVSSECERDSLLYGLSSHMSGLSPLGVNFNLWCEGPSNLKSCTVDFGDGNIKEYEAHKCKHRASNVYRTEESKNFQIKIYANYEDSQKQFGQMFIEVLKPQYKQEFPISFEPATIVDITPGKNTRGFSLLWMKGDGKKSTGLATDSEGNVYTTISGKLYSLDAKTGDENWNVNCENQNCFDVGVQGENVYTTSNSGKKLINFNRKTGEKKCEYDLEFATENAGGNILPFEEKVLIRTGTSYQSDEGRVYLLDSSCNLIYTIDPEGPNQIKSNPAINLNKNLLYIQWSQSDVAGSPVSIYNLETGELICKQIASDWFRAVFDDDSILSGLGRPQSISADNCRRSDLGKVQSEDDIYIGDIRDIAADSTGRYFLGSYTRGGALLKMPKGQGVSPLWTNRDFITDGLFSIHRMAIANKWAFITEGNGILDKNNPNSLWTTKIVDTQSGETMGSFGRGRMSRIGRERLVDGGIFFANQQYQGGSNPNIPLIAWELGEGSFKGFENLHGDEEANKYCGASCLEELQGIEANCDDVDDSCSFECTITNNYNKEKSNIVFSWIPKGTYEIREESGEIKGSGSGEIKSTVNLKAKESKKIVFERTSNEETCEYFDEDNYSFDESTISNYYNPFKNDQPNEEEQKEKGESSQGEDNKTTKEEVISISSLDEDSKLEETINLEIGEDDKQNIFSFKPLQKVFGNEGNQSKINKQIIEGLTSVKWYAWIAGILLIAFLAWASTIKKD